ncbi:Luciferase-like monooxygenase [Kribbella flavida DSM 17836]|uniref:Luciferase-like monooxygenase n=1 Tax=Kribbella flavida (strain DSM 17836 / JCM 10339 / NBRC 14399) TaxID=479435 RepID=D2PR74_KRIFD|nr:LLM class flavin-dependent oxidoreductase [Kribbella flavida]ADB33022.1 Luciferase-like monooxygenase [Kribbella flavida DSM 17836]
MDDPTFGVLHDFRQPLPHHAAMSRYYAESLDEVAAADQLGFDAVWMSEHHLTADGLLPSPLVMAAAIAARTTQLRIGTNILVLPLHHPLRVAEDAAVADLVSAGRLVLGVGQGYAEEEFAAFGADRRHRGTLLEEGITLLRRAWSAEPINLHGEHWSYSQLSVTPKPERPIPIYVGGVTAAGLRRAARLGDAVIIYCAKPDELRARRALLDQVAPGTPLTCTSILHVADDPEQAWAEVAPGIAYLEGQIATYGGRGDLPEPQRGDYLVGTPEQVTEQLVALHRDVQFDHFAHWTRLPGLSHHRALESLQLLATEVVPAVTEQLSPGGGLDLGLG